MTKNKPRVRNEYTGNQAKHAGRVSIRWEETFLLFVLVSLHDKNKKGGKKRSNSDLTVTYFLSIFDKFLLLPGFSVAPNVSFMSAVKKRF